MNKKQNVFEICIYIIILVSLLLYCVFGKSHKKEINTEIPSVTLPQATQRVQ